MSPTTVGRDSRAQQISNRWVGMRRLIITVICVAALFAGCATPVTTASPAPTSPVATVGGDAPATDMVPAAPVRMQHPESAATLQICVDVAPDALADGIERGPLLLDALATYIEQLAAEEGLARGLFIEAWTTADDAEGGAPLIEAEIPDYDIITVEAGLSVQERNTKLDEQRNQRIRRDAALTVASDVVEQLRTVSVPTTNTSDVLRCLSRANAVATGRDGARRVVVVASSLPVDVGTASLRGDLSSVRQMFVFGWGPDFPKRDEAWRPTFASAGASSNLYVYDFDDGIGGPLSNAVVEVFR
jgi:hypothetical protein